MIKPAIPIFDSHCHLDSPRFKDDIDQVIKRAHDQGVHGFIVPGVRYAQWHQQQTLSTMIPNSFHAYGIHPWYCQEHQAEHLETLDQLLEHAVAVGECGLDFSPNKADQSTQQWWFKAQLKLALKHQLPVIIHSVKSLDIISQSLRHFKPLTGVIHGFSGSSQQAESFIHIGFYIGIGTRLMQQSPKKFNALVTALPLKYLLLETDAPDGLKNQRNEPCQLIHIAQTIARLRHVDLDTILVACQQNTQELFQL